jgi:Fic family protein
MAAKASAKSTKSSSKVPASPPERERAGSASSASGASGASGGASKRKVVPAAAPVDVPKPLTLEERTTILEARLHKTDPEFQRAYRESLDMSWVYHDSALEGTVYTSQELRAAMDPSAPIVTDSSLQPICEEIRRHREALDFIRDFAIKKRQPLTIDVVKKIYLILHPEEGDIKTVKYRKDIPQHRLYFHEYCAPDKIHTKVKAVFDWLADPETRRARSPLRIAARAHYDLVRAFPFQTDSGKVGRLFMNMLLLRGGYPPAIIHHTERQKYYEALKGSAATMNSIVQESIDNALTSSEKLLDEYETRTRAFIS